MKKTILEWIKTHPIRAMFLIPIFLVAGISISHVVSWYNLTNPISWAIYLSVAIEIGAMTALLAATNKIKGGVWFMFGMVTFIQMIGNIFFSYKEIDGNSQLFKSWVELTSPVWEMFGSDLTDIVSLKRWLAFLSGGLLPIISLTSLHFFVKYDELIDESKKNVQTSNAPEDFTPTELLYMENIVKPEVIEEVIEVPMEEVIEEVIEVPVENVIEEVIEVPVEDVIEEVIEISVEEVIEVSVEDVIEEIVEEVIEVPVEDVIEEIVEEVIEVPVEDVIEEIVEQPMEEPIDEIVRLSYVKNV